MNAERSAELGAFLRSRRESISPRSRGLPAEGRRRVPGLRREEVSALAGVGLTWYTWLEQGRDISVSTHVLDALARVFALSAPEHDYLYRLAGVPDAGGGTAPSDDAGADPSGVRLLAALGDSPAAAFNERYDLLASNAGFDSLFPGIAHASGRGRNALLKMGRAADSSNPVADPEFLTAQVTQVRHAYARHIGDPEWEQFITEITGASPVIARAWDSHEVSQDVSEHRFHCPPIGWIRFHSARYFLDRPDGAFVQAYLPADATARGQFDAVISRGGVSFD